MSWFSAVTGKAENFLNKLDQSAAEAFKPQDDDILQPPLTSQFSDSESTTPVSLTRQLSSSASVPSKLHDLKQKSDPSSSFVSSPVKQTVLSTKTAAAAATVPKAAKTQSKKDSDEALFEFLNSKEPVETATKKTTPISSRHHSRQSSTSSTVSSKGVKGTEAVATNTAAISQPATEQEKEVVSHRDSPTGSNESADIEALAEAMQESPTGSVHSNHESDTGNVDHSQQHSSSLELENRLLRNEVASLNEEMASVLKQTKDAQTELEHMKRRVSDYNNRASYSDQLVRELQSREQDLTEALGAKDSQLAVLRVRLDEADRTVSQKQRQIDELQVERERILRDHTDSSGMHSQALDSLKQKLIEMEAALTREQNAYKKAQHEASERQGRLEQEQQTLADALTASERKYADERAKIGDLGNQLKIAKANAESVRLELTEYKDKASRILQSKERLIANLREGTGAIGDSAGISSLEFESLKQERDMMRDDLHQSKMTVENLCVEIQDLESQLQQESDAAADQTHSLEEQLSEEKRLKEDAEQELLKQKQELQYAIEELHKQKSAFQTRLNDRENEIEKLRNQLMTKSISSTSESELESRVRALTESLIQKQTVLEALSTEKNSLVLQLERLEQQYRDVQGIVSRSAPAVVSVHDDDDVRQRLPTFMREGPTDTEVTRRMKRAANSIDKFSIRLGVFLRRYPIARVFVIVYMLLLHLWVMIVLLTYQPEMHGSDYHPHAPKSR